MKKQFKILATLALTASCGHSAILYGGMKNIPISNTFTSIFVDVDDLVGSGTPTQQPGWDIDAFFGGQGFGNSSTFQPARLSFSDSSAILNLTTGSTVDNALTYFNAAAGSSTHIGTNPGQFASGTEGFIGFKNGSNFGWMRVRFSNTGGTGTIIEWAQELDGSAITVGVIPEPSSLALIALGGSLCIFRRNRSCK